MEYLEPDDNMTLNISMDDYDYDYDVSVATLPYKELIPVTLVYCATLLLGVVGNVLVIFSILRYRRMQTVTNIFLTSLASADLLLVLLCVPIQLAKWFTFTWEFGAFLCKALHYLQNVSVICSILTLTGMSMERYYAILHPMHAKFLCTVHRARKAVVLIWLLSCALAAPIIYGQIHKSVGYRRPAYWCVKEWPTAGISQFYEISMLLLIFVFPFIIITVAYVSISVELWVMTSRRATLRAMTEHKSQGGSTTRKTFVSNSMVNGGNSVPPIRLRRQRRTSSSDDDRTRKQVIKMLIIVIILFAICWGPYLIENVLRSFESTERLNYGHIKYVRQAFAVMAYANSCVNPIVYAFMSKNFRESFKHAIYSCLPRGSLVDLPGRRRRRVSFQTRSSSFSMTRNTASMRMDIVDNGESRVYDDIMSPDMTLETTTIDNQNAERFKLLPKIDAIDISDERIDESMM